MAVNARYDVSPPSEFYAASRHLRHQVSPLLSPVLAFAAPAQTPQEFCSAKDDAAVNSISFGRGSSIAQLVSLLPPFELGLNEDLSLPKPERVAGQLRTLPRVALSVAQTVQYLDLGCHGTCLCMG